MNDFEREQEQRRQAEATRRQEDMTKARREQAAALEKQRLEQKHKAQSTEQARQTRLHEARETLAREANQRRLAADKAHGQRQPTSAQNKPPAPKETLANPQERGAQVLVDDLKRRQDERARTVEARVEAVEKSVNAASGLLGSHTLDQRGQNVPPPTKRLDQSVQAVDGLTVGAVLVANAVHRAARNSRERQEQRIDRALGSMPPDRRLEAENQTRAEALAADLKRKQEGDRQRQPITNARTEREPERKTPESRPAIKPVEPDRQDYRQQARELAQVTKDYQHPEVQALRQKAQEAERAQENSLKASVDRGRDHTQHQPSVDGVQTGVAQAPTVGRSR